MFLVNFDEEIQGRDQTGMVDLCLPQSVLVLLALAHVEALDPHGHVPVELLLGATDKLVIHDHILGHVLDRQ